MGSFFGSDTTSNAYDQSTNLSGGADGQGINLQAGGTVNYTDGGAIQNAFEITRLALEQTQRTQEGALGLNASSLEFAEKIKNPLGNDIQKIGLAFVIGTVIVVAVVIMGNK